MSDRNIVLDLVVKNGLKPIGGVVEDPDRESGFLIFLRVSRDQDGAVVPSERKLALVAKEAEKEGYFLRIAFLDDKASEVDSAARSMLTTKYPDLVDNVVVSLSEKGATAWIEVPNTITADDEELIKGSLIEFLGFMRVSLEQAVFSTTLTLPTVTACINMIRKYAPLSKDELIQKLKDANFDQPAESWLDNMLDLWRKKGFLHRRSDGRYILTLAGLNRVGTRRNKLSPDVGHALAMARAR